MNLYEKYRYILSEVNKGHRGLIRLTPEELEKLNELLLTSSPEDLEKVLCVVEHSSSPHLKFEAHLLQLLASPLPDSTLVFALNSSRKHIIEARFQRGQRLEYNFLESLKKLLHHNSPEVVEWTLRVIEACGNQGIYFLQEFAIIKPPPWKWFNPHQRAIREIIALLEARWRSFEKSRF